MGLLKKISAWFGSAEGSDDRSYWIYTRCNRCGEKIRARIDLQNDLTPRYDEAQMTYYCRKVLIGEGRCFQKIEVLLTFDPQRRLSDQQISGGELITKEAYYAEEAPDR